MVEGFAIEVFPHPYQQVASPTPFLWILSPDALLYWLLYFLARFQAGRTASKHLIIPTPELKTCPVTVEVPFLRAFISRKLS